MLVNTYMMMEQNFENAKYGAERPYGIATVSMAVAIERIEKTLGSLPKLKKNFANMYEWNSLAVRVRFNTGQHSTQLFPYMVSPMHSNGM